MLRGENIIIFSSDDWSSGLKTSKYHVARQLARHNRVLYVNSIGLRAPTASGRDLRRIVDKLVSFSRIFADTPEGVFIHTPIAIPFRRSSRSVKLLNSNLLRFSIRAVQLRLSLKRPVVFAFVPTFNDVIGHLGEKAIAYYCIDDMRGYKDIDTAWFDREEERLLNRANCIINSAYSLHEGFAERGLASFHVPHGVDWSLFRKAVVEDLPVPDDLRDIPQPRLGFYGFLSDEWVDYPLLERIADRHPEWHIVLIGRPSADMDMDAVIKSPNIHYLGLKKFESLPAYTRHFSVGLIPFNLNALTLHCNPLKLLEYLSGGLPVVTTAIPEVERQYASDAYIAHSHDEYIDMCERALAEGSPEEREQRSAAAEKHSWERRAETISEIVRGYMR